MKDTDEDIWSNEHQRLHDEWMERMEAKSEREKEVAVEQLNNPELDDQKFLKTVEGMEELAIENLCVRDTIDQKTQLRILDCLNRIEKKLQG